MTIQESWARIRGQGFLGSVGVLVGGTGIAGAISALTLPILTRLYTPHDFSLLAVLTGMISIISIAACLRFDIATPVPEHDSEAANVLGLAILSLAAVVIVLSVAVLFVPASLLARFNQPDLESYLWLVPVGVLVVALGSALQFWLVRKKDFAAIARNRILQSGVGTGTQVAVGWFNGMIFGLLLGPTIAAAAGCVGLALRVTRVGKNPLSDVSWPGMRAAWSNYYRFPKYSALEALSNNLGIQLPIIMIAAWATGPEAGFLMLAISVLQAPMSLLGSAICQVFLSRAPQEYRLGHLPKFTATVLGGLLKSGIGPLIFGGLLAPELFAKVFGEEWRRAGVLMAWMTPWFVMQFLASPVSIALHVVNKQREALLLQLFGVVIRVAAVYGASLMAAGLISEAYALSGLVFYSVYLLVVLAVIGVRASDVFIEIRKAGLILLLWIAAGLLLHMAVSHIHLARWAS